MYKKDFESKVEYLKIKLESAGIDISNFGQGEAKTLEQLQTEIDEEETLLSVDEHGNVLRKIEGAIAYVFYHSPEGQLLKLKEEKQVFQDGRERIRNYKDGAVSEKKKGNETPEETVLRGIKEELGLEGQINFVKKDIKEETKVSPSYPGLKSIYINYCFDVNLTDDQFKPEGYVENDSGLTTYFVWEEVN